MTGLVTNKHEFTVLDIYRLQTAFVGGAGAYIHEVNYNHRECVRHAMNAAIGVRLYESIQTLVDDFPGCTSGTENGVMIPWARVLQAIYPGHRVQAMTGRQLLQGCESVIAGVGNLPCWAGGPQHAVAFRRIHGNHKIWDSELPTPIMLNDEDDNLRCRLHLP